MGYDPLCWGCCRCSRGDAEVKGIVLAENIRAILFHHLEG